MRLILNLYSFCKLYHNGSITGSIDDAGNFINVKVKQKDSHSRKYSSYKITGNISCASWLVVWDISTEVADVEENYDTDPEWGDERIPELKELNSQDNSLQCFVNTEIDDFQEDEDDMEDYF